VTLRGNRDIALWAAAGSRAALADCVFEKGPAIAAVVEGDATQRASRSRTRRSPARAGRDLSCRARGRHRVRHDVLGKRGRAYRRSGARNRGGHVGRVRRRRRGVGYSGGTCRAGPAGRRAS
jgi:hypothetical protein